jgi:hypothetical protein
MPFFSRRQRRRRRRCCLLLLLLLLTITPQTEKVLSQLKEQRPFPTNLQHRLRETHYRA